MEVYIVAYGERLSTSSRQCQLWARFLSSFSFRQGIIGIPLKDCFMTWYLLPAATGCRPVRETFNSEIESARASATGILGVEDTEGLLPMTTMMTFLWPLKRMACAVCSTVQPSASASIRSAPHHEPQSPAHKGGSMAAKGAGMRALGLTIRRLTRSGNPYSPMALLASCSQHPGLVYFNMLAVHRLLPAM